MVCRKQKFCDMKLSNKKKKKVNEVDSTIAEAEKRA